MERELPKVIYKYTRIDQYLYESLLNGDLWFSAPSEFNDPFDSNIPWSEYYSYQERNKFRRSIEKDAINENAYLDFFEKYDKCRNGKSVCCFSSVRDNLILWSHYSDKHKGVLLVFDVKELKKEFQTIKKVEYNNDLLAVDTNANPESIFEKYLFKKSVDWKLEKEIRILNEKQGSYKFPKNALLEICFGMKCPRAQTQIVIELTKDRGYKNIAYNEVIPARNKYGLKTLPIIIIPKPTFPPSYFD